VKPGRAPDSGEARRRRGKSKAQGRPAYQPTEPPDADPHVRWCGRGVRRRSAATPHPDSCPNVRRPLRLRGRGPSRPVDRIARREEHPRRGRVDVDVVAERRLRRPVAGRRLDERHAVARLRPERDPRMPEVVRPEPGGELRPTGRRAERAPHVVDARTRRGATQRDRVMEDPRRGASEPVRRGVISANAAASRGVSQSIRDTRVFVVWPSRPDTTSTVPARRSTSSPNSEVLWLR